MGGREARSPFGRFLAMQWVGRGSIGVVVFCSLYILGLQARRVRGFWKADFIFRWGKKGGEGELVFKGWCLREYVYTQGNVGPDCRGKMSVWWRTSSQRRGRMVLESS